MDWLPYEVMEYNEFLDFLPLPLAFIKKTLVEKVPPISIFCMKHEEQNSSHVW